MKKAPYELLEDNLVRVCMFCHPGESILNEFPELKGRQISHGVCPVHQVKWLAEIRAMAPQARRSH